MKSIDKSKTEREVILLMDDEPQYLSWLVEYLESKGYGVETASNLSEALQKIDHHTYRAIVADLSVPIPPEIRSLVDGAGKDYLNYPGLFLAHHARNKGYRSRQVIVYSVHDSATVTEVAVRIGVCYITKGRPKILKAELDSILSYDPTRDK